jgi:hypothetical protein
MRSSWLLDRRTCLKGLGATLALPLLETMGWADPPKGSTYKPPVRIGFMFMPCGVNREKFFPADPATYPVTLPPSLEPLRPVIDRCLVLGGLDNIPRKPFEGAAHAIELSTWLTAAIPDPAKRDTINIATSADQIAAQHLGLYTALPSLELGTRKNEASGTGQEGLNNRYYTTGNFRTATQPLPVETSPAEVLKRLFASRQSTPRKQGGPMVDAGKFGGGAAGGDEGSLDRSMLDLVLDGAKNLRGRISIDDQHQLDDYLDTVGALEKRVAAIERQQAEAAKAKSGKGDASAAPQRSAPLEVIIPTGEVKWSEHVKVLGDLLILAFQTDITRVGTLIASMNHGINYPELGFSESHHENSHHGNDPVKLEKVAKIDRFNIEQFAYLVGRMKSLREGAGSLLDNTIFMWGSGLGDGNSHTNQGLPCIIAGGGGGTIRSGRYVAKVAGNQGDLLTAILARAGVTLPAPIGIGTKLLPDLS